MKRKSLRFESMVVDFQDGVRIVDCPQYIRAYAKMMAGKARFRMVLTMD